MTSSELFRLFLLLKLLIFSISHISVLTVHANNSAADLIVFYSKDLNRFDWFMKVLVKPFIRWDAIHMLAIAKHGYLFENQFAFFPLLPMVSRYLAIGLSEYCGLKWIISMEPLMALIGIVFTNSCHYFATVILYKLTLMLFKSRKLARITSLLFIFNAASIQLSSLYTEAPFAFFSFAGIDAFYKNDFLLASLFWALASATRSNGIVLIGFFFYDLLRAFVFGNRKLSSLIIKLFKTIIYSSISISTFLGFQYYAYSIYCLIDNPTRPWCKSKIPNIYSFVQKEYWNVGWFNYYTVNNIPNFLFALPIIIICGSACITYFESDHLRFISLGLFKSNVNMKDKKLHKFFYDDRVLPHIYLLIFMLGYNLFVAHVQIITRVFTFMPVLYWFMAHLMINSGIRVKKTLLIYIGLYGLLGTALFSLNYPPA